MPYKVCLKCKSISYSASHIRNWSCPACSEDLSMEPVSDHFPLEEKDNNHKDKENTAETWLGNVIKWLKVQ